MANPPVTTAYSVKITDNTCNYDSSFTVNVTVLPIPFINATKSNDINCKKPFAQLSASGASNYSWAPVYALSNSSIANPIANPAVSTTYFVSVADNNGCTNTDSITVLVNFEPDGILLPNSFTPNGDGNNDCFGLRYYRDVEDLEFVIYNRYGITVFETHNAAECWNGRYKGQPADPGNYIYFIKAKTLCGNVLKKGSVLLIR
jgi:gliding motility-associated-like protein